MKINRARLADSRDANELGGVWLVGLDKKMVPQVRDVARSELMLRWYSTWCVGIVDEMRGKSVDTPPWLSWGSVQRSRIEAMPKVFPVTNHV